MTYFTKSQKFENEGTHHGLFLVIFGQNLSFNHSIIYHRKIYTWKHLQYNFNSYFFKSIK